AICALNLSVSARSSASESALKSSSTKFTASAYRRKRFMVRFSPVRRIRSINDATCFLLPKFVSWRGCHALLIVYVASLFSYQRSEERRVGKERRSRRAQHTSDATEEHTL